TSRDLLIAKGYLGGVGGGFWGGVCSWARLLIVGVSPVLQVLLPRVAALRAQHRASRGLVAVVGLRLGGGVLASLALPWWWAEPIMHLAFGPGYAAGGPTLRILWVSTALLVLQGIGTSVLLAADRTRGSWLLLCPCL